MTTDLDGERFDADDMHSCAVVNWCVGFCLGMGLTLIVIAIGLAIVG